MQADLDALAWDVSEHLSDLAVAADRVERATVADTAYWEQLYGQDELLTSLPGMGPVTAPTVRAFLGDAAGFPTAKAAAGYVGITPSNWSSGTVTLGGLDAFQPLRGALLAYHAALKQTTPDVAVMFRPSRERPRRYIKAALEGKTRVIALVIVTSLLWPAMSTYCDCNPRAGMPYYRLVQK